MKVKMQTTKANKRTDSENFYLTNDQLYAEWLIYKQSGTITDKMGEYMQMITTRLLGHSNFRGYQDDLKSDMQSDAILKMCKCLKCLKEEHRNSFFQYLTRAAYCSYLTTLKKYYKYENIKKSLYDKAIDKFNQLVPQQSN